MEYYTMHIRFPAKDATEALAIGEDSHSLLAVSLDVKWDREIGYWEVSANDNGDNDDWSVILPRNEHEAGTETCRRFQAAHYQPCPMHTREEVKQNGTRDTSQ